MDVSVANQVKMTTVPVWQVGLDCRQGEAVGLAGAVRERSNRAPSHRSARRVNDPAAFLCHRSRAGWAPNSSPPASPRLLPDLAFLSPVIPPRDDIQQRRRDPKFPSPVSPSGGECALSPYAPVAGNLHP